MNISFTAYGHPNITARHRNTVEITRKKELGREGDCIIGVNADFSPGDLKKFIETAEKARMTVEVSGMKEEIRFMVNKSFDDSAEIVIRKTDFKSDRTLGIKADKAAIDLKREFAERLSDGNSPIKIRLISE